MERSLRDNLNMRAYAGVGAAIYSGEDYDMTASFAGAPNGIPTFSVIAQQDTFYATFKAGTTLFMGDRSTLKFGYYGNVSRDESLHGGFLKGALNF